MGKKPMSMNTIKHRAPEPGPPKYRSEPNTSEAPKYKEVLIECLFQSKYNCNRFDRKMVLRKTKTKHLKYVCYDCNYKEEELRLAIEQERREIAEQERIFGKGKNFLTALEGL